MFYLMIMMSTFFVISANSWFSMWVGLEINMLSIIPLMNNMKTSYSTESSLKYFIIQAMASSILLMSIISLSKESSIQLINNLMFIFLNSSLLLKMGMSPFHFWFPEVLEGLNWSNCMIIMIWQKISPMIMIMYNSNNYFFLILVIIVGVIISGIMGINQISIRKIMAYSSINHMSWMLSSLLMSPLIWLNYFLIYVILNLMISVFFLIKNIFFFQQIFLLKNNIFLIIFILNFLALGGLPPFIGFFSKWLVIQILLNQKMIILGLFLVVFSLISLFYYTRLIMVSFLINLPKINLLNFEYYYLTYYWKFLMTSILSLFFSTLVYNLF
uniref:NADH-ubiquinone oxidoreductase chain 2 n=1 Tax=Stenus comma TaxID=513399 RepID=A0A0S2M943_9COLE|nr:NADH deshydrogenase subunit 2 [Stenus comma]